MFARSMGSALGIAVFGAIVNNTLGSSVGHQTTAAGIPATALEPAMQQVFLGSAAAAVLLAVAIVAMPRWKADAA
jgi:hypothetical protein